MSWIDMFECKVKFEFSPQLIKRLSERRGIHTLDEYINKLIRLDKDKYS